MFRLQVTTEIELRQMEMRDAEEVFALSDRNRDYLREWLPWLDHTHSVEDTKTFITQALEQFHSGHGPNAAIWMGGAMVGTIGCHRIDWENRHCSIGYFVDREYQGKGIITRSTAVLVDYLFRERKLHRVVIQCGTGNTRSCAVPQRLGFTREGVAREAEWVGDRWVDLVVWSMLEQDWPGAENYNVVS